MKSVNLKLYISVADISCNYLLIHLSKIAMLTPMVTGT